MFDYKAVWTLILATFTTTLTGIAEDKLPAVEGAVSGYLTDAEQRLSDLANDALKGEANNGISTSFLFDRLKDEADILKSELMSLEVIGASIAQAIVNETIGIVEKQILNLLPATT